jgi:phospholipase C
MSSTTPIPPLILRGKISHEENDLPKVNIQNDDYGIGDKTWQTFPEVLEDDGILLQGARI